MLLTLRLDEAVKALEEVNDTEIRIGMKKGNSEVKYLALMKDIVPIARTEEEPVEKIWHLI